MSEMESKKQIESAIDGIVEKWEANGRPGDNCGNPDCFAFSVAVHMFKALLEMAEVQSGLLVEVVNEKFGSHVTKQELAGAVLEEKLQGIVEGQKEVQEKLFPAPGSKYVQ